MPRSDTRGDSSDSDDDFDEVTSPAKQQPGVRVGVGFRVRRTASRTAGEFDHSDEDLESPAGEPACAASATASASAARVSMVQA